MKVKYSLPVLGAILLIAIFLRFVDLDETPSGFIPEEVSTGWNAYSLLRTGRDEWGIRLPVIFRETGGFKLALNSYLIVPVMAVFGVNEFAVRFPTALAGVIAVGLTYVLTIQLFKKTTVASIAALLLAISPWHISMGRYAVDVNWGIPLFLFGLILLIKAQTNSRLLLGAAISFGLTYYTYFNYVVFTFLFLCGYFLWERKLWLTRDKWKWVGLFFVIQIIGLSPYILQPNLTIRFRQATSVSQIGFINRINEHRHACDIYYSPVFCRFVYNKVNERVLELTRQYLNHFSTTVYFLYGSQLGLSGMPDRWGFFYVIEFGLLICGIVVLFQKRLWSSVIILWLFLYGVPGSLAAEAHIWRMLTFLPLPQIIAAAGLVELVRNSSRRILIFGIAGAYFVLLLRFLVDYNGFFRFNQGTYSYFGFRDTYAYLKTIESNYDYIVVAPNGLGFDQLYIYYLFYMQPDPWAYQIRQDVELEVGSEGWVKVKRIGKWHFVSDVRNVVFTLPDKTLLVTDQTFKEKEPLPQRVMLARLLKTIDFANGDVAFKILELTKNPYYTTPVHK